MQARDVLPPGTLLDGKYRIISLIGAGGFGMTYAAHDQGLNQPVAVKEYYPAQFGMREGTLTVGPATAKDQDLFDRLKESFLREARTLAQFRHPAIVRVLSVFEGHGTAYMVMEYETGKSLKAWLEELGRRPTQDELDRIVMPLLVALDTMHAASFLHRDIAPDNIIVRADGGPVLLDFGAARRVMAELSGALTGIVKQGYSPQEQYANDPRAQGPWSDIYALGATLYRCVTGKTPDEATLRMLDDPVQPAASMNLEGYRAGFLAAIDRSISLRPKNRPQTIAELRGLLAGPPVVVAATPAASPVTSAGTGGWSRLGEARGKIAGATAKSPQQMALAAGAAAVLLGGMGWGMLGWNGRAAQVSVTPVMPPVQADRTADAVEQAAERRAGETSPKQDTPASPVAARDATDPLLEQKQKSVQWQTLNEQIGYVKREIETASTSLTPDHPRLVELNKLLGDMQRQLLQLEAKVTTAKPAAPASPKLASLRLPPSPVAPANPSKLAPSSGPLAAALEHSFGACPFCDDVAKRLTPGDAQELKDIAGVIERTWDDVRDRRSPGDNAAARAILEQLAKAEIEPDPMAKLKLGRIKCTTYNFGFLDKAAERTGTFACDLRMVRIGGEVSSLTLERANGDGFHASFKPYRLNVMAYLGRTFLKGHAVTRYNAAVPKNRENTNYGNKTGLLVTLAGKPTLISSNKNGVTEPDDTFFEVIVLE